MGIDADVDVVSATIVWGVVEIEEKRDDEDVLVDVVERDISSRYWQRDVLQIVKGGIVTVDQREKGSS